MKFLIVFGALLLSTLVQGDLDPTLQVGDQADGSRIVGGYPTVPSQFPHMAHLKIYVGEIIKICSGSLISSKHILTAAHCLESSTLIIVRLGSGYVLSAEQIVTTIKYILHSRYNPKNLNNDIGLVELERDIRFTDRVQPIALPRRSQMSETFINRVSIVSGWGSFTNDGPISDFLRFSNLTIISNRKCIVDYNANVVIHSTICGVGAMSPQQSTCTGDDGGAMIVFDDTQNNWIQIGIVSFFSKQGCGSGRASGFVRPDHFWPFISFHTGIPIRN